MLPSTNSCADSSTTPKLSVVIPVYRSEECLNELIRAIRVALAPYDWGYEVILVNDFSPDRSWQVIESLCHRYPFVVGVDLRRNFGQDNAILTGLRLSRGRYVAVMDDDLQHDPKYLPALMQKTEEGADVVYADFGRKQQKLWKNMGSWINGKIADRVLWKPKDVYLSPYKVIVRDVADLICNYAGPKPYIDGLLFQATWRMASIPVEHFPRYAGRSTYSVWKALEVSARLIFSFSVKPVRLVTWCGLVMALLALLAAGGITLYRLLLPEAFPAEAVGWSSLMVVFLLVSGIQMTFLGILGEYVGRAYLLVNRHPQTSIRTVIGENARAQSSSAIPRTIDEEVTVGGNGAL
jgi:undecaprenyl-phosphate 4-deoxy-4-formamido-L-arabinose transferase